MIRKLNAIRHNICTFVHFDVLQLTCSVKQFDFENIRIQDKKYFMQPWGLVNWIVLNIL